MHRKISSRTSSYVELKVLPWIFLCSLVIAIALPLLAWAVDNDGDNLDDGWEAQYGITTNAYDASNLVGWWQLNGTNNTDSAADRSGSGFNGTLTNFPSIAYHSGLFSNALDFATNSAVGFPTTNSALNLTNGFTFSAWFQTTNATPTLPTIVATWQDTASTGWSIGASSTGVATITFYDGATQQVVQGSGATTSLYDGGWHQLAATLDTNQVAIVYVDGEPEATNTITGWSPGSVGSFTFGETGTNVNNAFNLDETRLYNRALGAAEVPQLPITYTDVNGSGLTIYDDYIEHLSPLDTNSIVSSAFATSGLTGYYGTSTPTLTKTNGDGQIVSVSTFASNSLVVHVVGSGGALANAPVTFTIQPGSDGLLSLSSSGGATTSTTLSLTTDSSGNATVYYEAGSDTLQNNLIVATAVTQSTSVSVTFTEHCGVQSGLALWLKGDTGVTTDVNGNITAWSDQSASGNNVTSPYGTSQTTGRATVLPSGLNSKPVVHMPGVGTQYLTANDSSSLRPSSAVTIVSVMRPTSTSASNSWLLNKGNTSTVYYGLGVYPSSSEVIGNVYAGSNQLATSSTLYVASQPYLVADVYDGAHQTIYQAGQSVVSSTLTGSMTSSSGYPLYLGYAGSSYAGDVGEVMVYNRALSSTELTAVQGYLADKWGVYAPSATWPAAYSSAEQTLIASNKWTKAQADTYASLGTANPTIPVDMALWLKGDTGVTTDVNGNITAWNDQSVWGNNFLSPYTVSQTTGRATVLTNSLNSNPVVHLPGAGTEYLSANDSPSLKPSSAITVVSVMRPTTASGSTSWLLSKGGSSAYYALGVYPSTSKVIGNVYAASYQMATSSPTYTVGQPYLVADVYDGAHQTLYQSGQSVSSTALTGSLVSSSGYPLYLGYGGTTYTGDVGEVMVYGRALSSTELTAVQGYLADKWGVYAPSATWPSAYTTAVQTLISTNQWTKAQANTYVALSTANPTIPVDMALWLKGDTGVTTDVNGNITAWNDQSVWGNNVQSPFTTAQTSGRATVLTNSLNSKPVIHMPGASYQYLSAGDSSSLRPSSAVTIVSVMRPAGASGTASWLLNKGSTSPYYGVGVNQSSLEFMGSVYAGSNQTATSSTPYVASQPYLVADVYDGAHQTLYQAGQSVVSSALTGSMTSSSGYPLYLGYGGSAFTGDVGEVMVYGRALTSGELSAVQGYLADKWGVYAPSATWPSAYSSAEQTLITSNQWTKSQADTYAALATANPSIPVDMALWLKGDAGVTTDVNGNITAWSDQSAFGNNVVSPCTIAQTTGRSTTLANSLNGKSVVHMPGTTYSWLSAPDNQAFRSTNGITVVSVMRPAASNTGSPNAILEKGYSSASYNFGLNNALEVTSSVNVGSNQYVASSLPYTPTQPIIAAEVYNGTTETLYQAGQSVGSISASGTPAYPTAAPLYIGYSGTEYSGDLGEVILFNRALTGTELSAVQGYLSDKWGLYAPSATWPNSYTSAVQALITANQWTKAQADAYVAAAAANPSMPMDMALWLKADGSQGSQADVVTDTSGNVTQWTDESVNQNNAFAIAAGGSGMAQLVNLPHGKAVSFAAAPNSRLAVPDSVSLRPTSGVTVFLVARPGYEAGEQNTGIIAKQGSLVPYSLIVNVTTQICSAASGTTSSGGVAQTITESSPYSLSLDGNSIWTYFYNGSSQKLTQSSNIIVSAGLTGSLVNGSGSQPLYLGYAPNISGTYYPGTVSEVLVYDRALTSSETAEVAFYLSVKYGLAAVPPPIISGTAGGTYASTATVNFASGSSGLDIRYTLDGSTPTSSSALYTGSITLTQSSPLTFAYFYGSRVISALGAAQYYVSDTNQIGISDAWQMTYFGHLLTSVQATALSPGGSGLTNLQDYLYGYNPILYSTNGDGLSDLTNYSLGYSATNTDINGYGLTNAQQLALGLDPFDTGVNPTPPSPPTPVTQSPPVITIDLPTNAISVP